MSATIVKQQPKRRTKMTDRKCGSCQEEWDDDFEIHPHGERCPNCHQCQTCLDHARKLADAIKDIEYLRGKIKEIKKIQKGGLLSATFKKPEMALIVTDRYETEKEQQT